MPHEEIKMTKWEYKTVIGLLETTDALGGVIKGSHLKSVCEAEVQKLGEEGWELVGLTAVNLAGSTKNLLLAFKRPLE